MQFSRKCHNGLSERLIFFRQPKNWYATMFYIRQPLTENPQEFHLGISMNSATFTALLQSCTRTGSLILGKLVHARMIKTSFKSCMFLENNLLNMYSKCGEMDNARQLFDRMPRQDIISWNSLISGYSQVGFYHKAMEVFNEARVARIKLDKFTYATALSVCARAGNIVLGKLIHGLITISGLGDQVFLTNSLIDMYSKCGRIDQARCLFDNSDELDDVSWNSLIAGYVQVGSNDEMMKVLIQMYQSGFKLNTFALGSVIKACCSNFHGSKVIGKMLHGCTIKLGLDFDVFVATALLDMYAKIGDLDDAIKIFWLIPDPNVVTFNAMIAGFFRSETEVSDKFADEALNLFSKMRKKGMKPSKYTFSSILKACNVVGAIDYGKQIHAQIFKNNLQSDEFIGSTLIDLYSLLGSTEDGLRCFHSTLKVDIVSWTSMIGGCVRNGQFELALNLFSELLTSGMKPDEFTISSVLSACANLAAARSGEQIQCYAMKTGIAEYTIVANSQICMYAKSGDIDAANLTFKETRNPDVVSWSVMISSHAQHGCAKEALSLFESMKDSGITPNHITYLGVLTACSHGGLVDDGFRYFESMKRDHVMNPNVKHCSCIVDLLGRAGRLADAENFIINSGFKDDPVMWRALLGSCRVHKDTVMGKRIAERVIELEPQAAASYVLLYNIYLDSGIKLLAMEIRDLMKNRGVKKEPGLSWIEIGTTVNSFVAGDRSHPKCQAIYAKLEEMLEKIKKIGYVDETSAFETSEQDQKNGLVVNYHSEKLAVVLGILDLPKSAPIRVMKNLRVCHDCHTTMKFFSKVENREIVLRDPIRFHRFIEGSCSCKDYW
ncbi:pentatricopeptide repeat-containing protein At3g13880 [Telopea speciosissima]|uniref:pentatricopeptide repeat-containing protein At3g13880 n=1 Tax=Telopea speciosissima TaxID=54955 RepID=UPI001CC3E532|nr:pentatricopeptide repeat-containing protein At3g13880 [Telopea speciosissima]